MRQIIKTAYFISFIFYVAKLVYSYYSSYLGTSLVSDSSSLTLLPQWLVQISQYVPIRTVWTRPHRHTVSLSHACVVVPVPPTTVKPVNISDIVPSTSTGSMMGNYAVKLIGAQAYQVWT